MAMCAIKMQQRRKGEVGKELVEVAAGGLVGTRVWSELTQGLGNGLKDPRAESGHRAAGRDSRKGIAKNNWYAIPVSSWPK